MTGDELVHRFEKLCITKPDVSTGALMVELFGDYREEIDSAAFSREAVRVQAIQEIEQAQKYRVALREAATTYGYITKVEYAFTELELHNFAVENNLDYNKLWEVAMGDREVYHGYAQGEFYPGKTYGKKYIKPDTDKFPGENEPTKEKVGARGLFRRQKVTEDD